MTDEHSHRFEHFRAFADASRNLCRTLFSAGALQNQELLVAIISALGDFPDEVYEDRESIEVLDALVDDRFPFDSGPYLAEAWSRFLLKLGFAHIRHHTLFGTPQSIERALFLAESGSRIVSREASPKLWALLQFLIGNSKRLSGSVSGETPREEVLAHYHNALEVIRRDEDPHTWVRLAAQTAHVYAEIPTGDRTDNLRTAADIFIDVLTTWEEIGNVRRVAETGDALGDVLTALNSGAQEMQRGLESYRASYMTFQKMGDAGAAEAVAEKIKLHETVNFTTYYPRAGAAGRKYGFVVYAHLPELRDDVEGDAQKFSAEFRDEIPTPRRSRSDVKLVRGTIVTVVPECEEMEFDPPSLAKKWDGGWTRFLFDFKPGEELVGEVVVVRISIQVAGIEIASISNCAIEVVEAKQTDADENPLAQAKSGAQTSALYQKIFVSYSRQDREITESYKLAQTALGNDTFVDVDDLRAGEDWKAGLARAIDVADVFQLFWSRNSAGSEYCRYEWNYALKYRCPDTKCVGFVRPVYWEKPMPNPPPELGEINFKYVPLKGEAKPDETV